MFVHLKYLYPECFVLLEKYKHLGPLHCFMDSCPANSNCAEKLAKRVHYLFEEVWPKLVDPMPKESQVFSYFKVNKSVKAGVFSSSMDEPSRITLNPYAFKKFRKEGEIYKWHPTDEFLNISGTKELILPSELIRES